MELGYIQIGANDKLKELLAYIDAVGRGFFSASGSEVDDDGIVGRDSNGVNQYSEIRSNTFADVSTPDSAGNYFLISTSSMRNIWSDLSLDGNDEKQGILELEATKASELGLVIADYVRPPSPELI